jgi:maltose/moltooligosaccharide transporter
MENKTAEGAKRPVLKLNYRRTMIIGFAFFGILLFWSTYDNWCSPMLMDAFAKIMYNTETPTGDQKLEVQYLVGIMMALDNLAALIMLPIFGHLSDKTHTKIGKRMPYILVGTFGAALAFPFIPLVYYCNNLAGLISLMAVVIFFMMMYRNPAVALMPDITPKPLRSKANGVINIMGYLGGGVASILGMFLTFTQFTYGKKPDGVEKGDYANYVATWETGNIWTIEIPFLIASVMMVISCIFLFKKIKENELETSLRAELDEGEREAAVVDSVANDEEKPMTKANKTMLWLILIAEFFWFIADNGVGTYLTNYIGEYMQLDTGLASTLAIVGGVAGAIGFMVAGFISDKIGRKWTIMCGLFGAIAGYALFAVTLVSGLSETWIKVIMFAAWIIKGFGFSLVHNNSFPMVVELCSSKKIGKFTGYYYASSMAAQTITSVLLGLLLKTIKKWQILPFYALGFIILATVVFVFVANVKTTKTQTTKGLEALGGDD